MDGTLVTICYKTRAGIFALWLNEAHVRSHVSVCVRESFVVGSLYHFYLFENICQFCKTSLLARHTGTRATYVIYANAHSRINSLYHFSLC
jgi:hypothetical protein